MLGIASAAAAAPPQRIVAIAPSVVEILFTLGLGERVAGVGDYCRWPPEAAAKPRVGGLFDVRLEAIVALDPDLAVLLPGQAEEGRQLRRLGIDVLTVPHETVADVETAIAAIAERAGVREAGAEVLRRFGDELAADPMTGSPRVLLTVTRAPGGLGDVLVAGPGTFLHELLERLGAVNVFGDAPLAYPRVGADELLRRRPEVIVELQPEPLDARARAALAADWRTLDDLGGVGHGCVRVIEGDYTVLPGPRLPRLYRELRAAVLECAEAGAGR